MASSALNLPHLIHFIASSALQLMHFVQFTTHRRFQCKRFIISSTLCFSIRTSLEVAYIIANSESNVLTYNW
jgi:hypothetical protein